MGEDRPQGSGVWVGRGVKVGVSVGGTVAVLVAGAVGEVSETGVVTGAAQPAKMEKSTIQKLSCVLRRLVEGRIGFIVWLGLLRDAM